jgi:hypothetical protein
VRGKSKCGAVPNVLLSWLKKHVREISKVKGACDFCGSEDVPLVNVRELAAMFYNLLSTYVIADSYENGEPIIDLIQWHWQVFEEDTLSKKTHAGLLKAIANSDWDDDDGEPMLNLLELRRES